jgi:sialate O-acetylesterase
VKLRWLGLALIFCAVTGAAHAKQEQKPEFRFAAILSDNMVLQQQKKARIWGWARPGADIAVTITEDQAVAQPYLQQEEVTDKSEAYSVTVKYVEQNAPVFKAQTKKVKADGEGAWVVEFDAMPAGFTPKYIVAKTGDKGIAINNVLIGEIWVCAGQSNMEWSGFNRQDREKASADFPALRYVAWNDSWYKPLDDVRNKIGWQECSPESAQRFSAVPYLFGQFLHRYLKVPVGIINVARGGTLGQAWCLREELDNVDNKIIKTVLKDYDAETATWNDPKQVQKIMAEWEKTCEQKKAEHEKAVAEAKKEGKPAPRLRLPKAPGDPRSGWSPPAGLFNATVMPISKLRVKGVLYYQGENNNFMRWTRYEYTFPKVPVSFRKAFGDENLPFGCISQPGWGTFGLDPEVATVAEGYAIVRDIQSRALANDPNGGMIATYPTGNSYIHPNEKFPVAEYASLWALARVYGKPVVHRGNTYQEMKKRDGKIYLFFASDPVVYDKWKHIENNAYWQVLPCAREGNAEFQGFIIAGSDQRWYPATARHAKLDGKCCIEVLSDLVEDPVAVRYGWANWPTGNMVGRERLPVPVFRTDNWPIPEGVNYSQEARDAATAKLDELKTKAKEQALDRKIRQIQIDLPTLEKDLYGGNVRKQVESKISRIETILDELQKDPWLSGRIEKYPALVEKIKAMRKAKEDAKAETAGIE